MWKGSWKVDPFKAGTPAKRIVAHVCDGGGKRYLFQIRAAIEPVIANDDIVVFKCRKAQTRNRVFSNFLGNDKRGYNGIVFRAVMVACVPETVVPYDIQFTYTLKDGSVKTRHYDRASYAKLEAMLALDETETVQRAVYSDSVQNGAIEAYTNGEIYLRDDWYSHFYRLTLTKAQRDALLQAIQLDLYSESPFPASLPGGRDGWLFTLDGENDLETFSFHLNNAFV